MGTILEMDNYQVTTADNGLKALEILETAGEGVSGVDLLVVDLDMGRLTGIELLLEMRERGHSMPVMVVTGHASKATVVELLRQGVADFLDKPVNLEEFRSRIGRLAALALKRRRQEAGTSRREPPPASSATVVDLACLGVPYAARRLIEQSTDSHLALACRRPGCFDLLLADFRSSGPDSFYLSVLVKAYCGNRRGARLDGLEFMRGLDAAIREGGLGQPSVSALLARLLPAERRLEIYPAGYAAQIFLGAGEPAHMTSLQGAPLGGPAGPRETLVEIPYRSRDRLVLYAEGGSPLAGPELSLLAEAAGPVETVVDRLWKDLLAGGRERRKHDLFLLGVELP
jgi:CheY-like chemotaxis protein